MLIILVIFVKQYGKVLYELLSKERPYSIKGTFNIETFNIETFNTFNIESRKVYKENALESITVPWEIRINE